MKKWYRGAAANEHWMSLSSKILAFNHCWARPKLLLRCPLDWCLCLCSC